MKGLPEIDTVTLKRFIESKVSTVQRADMRQQSRGLWLNDRLCRGAAYCDDFDGLVDLAHTLNLEIEARGLDPLPDAEIIGRADAVWRDVQEGKIQKWLRTSGVARSTEAEALMLCNIDHRHAGDAHMLLCVLKLKHSARCQRGETFNFNPKAMALADVLPGWSRERYEKARNLLLEARLLVCEWPLSIGSAVPSQPIPATSLPRKPTEAATSPDEGNGEEGAKDVCGILN